MKIALVHEYLIKLGGAERVLCDLHELYPDAPVYTLLYDEGATKGVFKDWDIRTSFLQKMPRSRSKVDYYRALMPLAVEQWDFSDYDVVISNNYAFNKGIITKPETIHISYCHTPTRFLWHQADQAGQSKGWLFKRIMPYVLNYLRVWDRLAAERVDYYLANSKNVQERIKKYYDRDSELMYPPVDLKRFTERGEVEKGDYFLIVSRLEKHKSVDLAIQAFNDLKVPLKIIGEGTEKERLQKIAKSNIEFLGEITDDEVTEMIAKAKAFIYPQVEDFGITALEAQASGTPVIALGKGGALETVIEEKTGIFFDEPTAPCLIDAVQRFNKLTFKREDMVKNASQFDREVFKERFGKTVEKIYKENN